MRTIHSQGYTPRHEGGPARKLAAATHAVMEPVEGRLMMSITPATEQAAAISAKYETVPAAHSGSAAEDSAVWVNPSDASASTIIGTDKQGALTVYSLDGKVVQTITGAGYNSVDVRGNLVAATNLSTNSINFFTVDPSSGKLSAASARTITPTIGGTIYGLTMYQSADSGKTYVFVTNRAGKVEQFEITAAAGGKYDAHSVRKFSVGSIAEGMVADDQTGALYVSQEDVAIWKYGAEPTDGSVRTQVDKIGSGGHLSADIEGLALYKAADGQGYLIASSQGSSDYVVYDRQTGEYVTRFKIAGNGKGIDGVQSTAGIEVSSVNLGGDFSGGVFIAQDSKNDGNENFKIVSWSSIANAQAIPLAIDNTQTPVPASTTPDPAVPTPTPVDTTPTPVVTPPVDVIPVVSGRPDAKNTGTTGSLTAVNASSLVLKSGQTYSNLIIKGGIDIRGLSNITFQNVVFDADGAKWAVRADNGVGTNRVFKNCEFKNMASSAIYGGDFAVYDSYVHDSAGDGFKPTQNALIQGCYVTRLGMSTGAHADGVQIRGGHNIKIVGNYFDMPKDVAGTSTNAAMFLQKDTDGTRPKDVTFDGNWCLGGNYTVCCYDVDASSNISVTNNIFYSGSPRYGFGNIFDGVVWSDNVTDAGVTATTKMK